MQLKKSSLSELCRCRARPLLSLPKPVLIKGGEGL